MLKHRPLKIIVICCLLLFITVLSGCAHQDVLTKKELNNSFNQSTDYLLETRGMVAKQLKDPTVKKVTVTTNQKKYIEHYQQQVRKQQEIIRNSRYLSNYPRSVYQYNKQVVAYLIAVKNEQSPQNINRNFNSVTKIGTFIVVNYLSSRPTNNYRLVMAIDDYSRTNIDHQRSTAKQKKTTQYQQRLLVQANIMLGIFAVILIILIYIQPSHQTDTLEALTDVRNSRSLFDRPKPQGANLAVNWSTKVFLIIIVVLILVTNYMLGR